METLNKILEILGKVKTLGLTSKITFVLVVILCMVCYLFASCTSTRTMSVKVDKAENIHIFQQDSVSAVSPFI